jgi:hypothetical protein
VGVVSGGFADEIALRFPQRAFHQATVNALLIVLLAFSTFTMLLDICGVRLRLCSMVILLMPSTGLNVGVLFCDMDTTKLCSIPSLH